jgi:methionyl-tRNA formyltransferase
MRDDIVESDAVDTGGILDGAVRTADGWLILERVQPEGKAEMSAEAWLNGARPRPGEMFDR